MKRKSRKILSARSFSRILAMKSVYQYLLSEATLGQVLEVIEEDDDYRQADEVYLTDLVQGIWKYMIELRQEVMSFTGVSAFSASPVELSILISAAYELRYRTDVPYQVIINEAIEVTKIYGGMDSFRYINGILDKLRLNLRLPIEPIVEPIVESSLL